MAANYVQDSIWVRLNISTIRPDQDIRIRAADTMGHFGEVAKAGAPALLEMLEDGEKDQWASRNAAWALGKIGPAGVETLVAALPRKEQRRRALFALGEIGSGAKGAAPALFKELEDADPVVRASAAVTLFRIDPDKLPINALAEALGDKDAEIRQSAARSLGSKGAAGAAAVPSLRVAVMGVFIQANLGEGSLVHTNPRHR